ncbi:unnamed protein product, partial [marine sediment metagenome]
EKSDLCNGFYVDMDAVLIVCFCSKGRAGGLVEIR